MVHVRPQAVVDSALRASDAGMSDAENAAKHSVAVKTIRRWRREYQRRGKPRGQTHCTVACPRCHGAELDAAASVLDLMGRVKPGGRPHVRQVPGCVVITVGWNHWPCLFPQHGPGRKHQRKIILEDWQIAIAEEHAAQLLRGLLHSDGSRTNNWATRQVRGVKRRYDYPRWEFANRSEDIIQICCWALDLVGVAYRVRCVDRVAVSRQEAVAALDRLIGPKQ
jgi:hypothetical protein